MLAISLYYLNFDGRCTLRPREVVRGDGAGAGCRAGAAAAPPPIIFWRLFLGAAAREALRLPF